MGKFSEKDIGLLNLHANYPCRLKTGVFVLYLRGEAEASINLTQFKAEAGSFITILPGTIFRIHRVDRGLQVYFIGFSSDFINQANTNKSVMDMHYVVKDSSALKLKREAQSLLRDYFGLLIKTYQSYISRLNRGLINHLLSGVLVGVSIMYEDKTVDTFSLSKAEIINKNFTRLVMQGYTMQRSVAWCAKRFSVT